MRTLETALEQIDFLESLSPQLQEGLVAATLDGAETELAQVQQIAAAWKSGDPAPIERLLLTDMKGVDAKVYDTLLVGRNRRWMPKLEAASRRSAASWWSAPRIWSGPTASWR